MTALALLRRAAVPAGFRRRRRLGGPAGAQTPVPPTDLGELLAVVECNLADGDRDAAAVNLAHAVTVAVSNGPGQLDASDVRSQCGRIMGRIWQTQRERGL